MVRALVQSFRSLALKIASYGVMHLIVAIAVAYALTRDWRIALAVGIAEPIVQTIAYSIHDRVWHRIERRRMLSNVEEAAEAFTARLSAMDMAEQQRIHGQAHAGHSHMGHGHALPREFPRDLRQVALKTVTYCVMHFVVAVSVAFTLTGDIRIALAIGLIEPLIQTVFFTVHDRIWTRIEARKAAKTDTVATA